MNGPGDSRKRRGFTVIELLTVVVVMGILANIATPIYQEARRRADAAAVIGAVHTIRVGVYDNFAARSSYPPSAGWRVVPAEMRPSLPGGFKFQYKTVDFRWRRWSNAAGVRRGGGPLIGVELRTSDQKLLKAIRNAYKGPTLAGGATAITLILD